MRKTYTMTQEQYDKILDASKPVPMIMLQCGEPPSARENAYAAWAELGEELGFVWKTVCPGSNKFEFTAEAT